MNFEEISGWINNRMKLSRFFDFYTFLFFLYFFSCFVLNLSLIPSRIILAIYLILILFQIRSFSKKKSNDYLALVFLGLPLTWSLISLCDFQFLLFNIIILVWFLFFKTNSNYKILTSIYHGLNIALYFVIGFCLLSALIKSFNEIAVYSTETYYWWNNFTHKKFLAPLKLHPTYLAMFILSALNYVFNKVFEGIIKNQVKAYDILNLLGLFSFLVLVSSKISYVAFLVLFTMFIIRLLIMRNMKVISMSLAFLGLVFFVMFKTLPSIKDRLYNDYRIFQKAEFQTNNESKVSERIYIWSAGIQVFKKKWLFGNYCSDSKKLITEESESAFFIFDKNAHNNFIEVAIKYGIFGVATFVYFVVSILSISAKRKDLLLLGEILIFIVISLTESTLVRELGIIHLSLLMQMNLIKNK